MKHRIHHLLYAALLWLSCLLPTQAAEERWIRSLHGTGIAASARISVHDPAWGRMISAPAEASYRRTEAMVRLRFDDSRWEDFSDDWTLTVSYKLTLRRTDGSVIPAPGTPSSLTITYDHYNPYRDVAVDVREDVAWATLEVTSVTGPGFTMPPDIYLDLILSVDRYYTLSSTEAPTFDHPPGGLAVDGEQGLPLHWSYVEGAVSYDLEWLFVDAGTEDPATTGFAYDMRNATRVNITGNSYTVPLAYPSGVVVFRIRAVGLTGTNGLRLEGTWAGAAATGTTTSVAAAHKFIWNGLESGRIWTYTSSFAEQGKRSQQLSFFDASLRERQSIALLNTDQASLLNERFYDHLGRPALQTLPYPVAGRSLAFHPDQALISGSTHYGVANFDVDAKFTTPDLFPGSGPGLYYSTGGSQLGVHGAYTPAAAAVPFMRTTYWNDGTGRVKEQSRAGEGMELSSHHTDRFFFGTPGSQYELDRLFGSEVGPVQHYRKSFQVDPNGVTNVTYQDPQGRTIATALAGDPPVGMDPVASPGSTRTVTADLEPLNQLDGNGAWTVSSTITIPAATDITLHYGLGSGADYEDCITKDCVYDLRICILDDTGAPMDLAPGDAEETCFVRNGISTLTGTDVITFPMPAGVFTIQKQLIPSASTIAQQQALYMDHTPSCVPVPPLEPVECGDDCLSGCTSSYYLTIGDDRFFLGDEGQVLGPVDEGDPNYSTNLATVNGLIDACEYACQQPAADLCMLRYERLILDMRPGGQYFDDLPHEFDPGYDPNAWLSANLWPDGYFYWDTIDLHDAQGQLITTWDGVRANWDHAWSVNFPGVTAEHLDGLVKYHPEWCQYTHYCLSKCEEKRDPPVVLVDEPFYDGRYYDEMYAPAAMDPTLVMDNPTHPLNYLFNPLGLPRITTFGPPVPHTPEEYQPAYSGVTDDLIDCWEEQADECLGDLPAIATSLQRFFSPDGGLTYYSVWYVLNDPQLISNGHGAYHSVSPAVRSFFDMLHGTCVGCNDGLIGTGPDQVPQYVLFRSIYEFYRQRLAYKLFRGSCTRQTLGCEDLLDSPNNDGLTAEGFVIHYPRNILLDDYPTFSPTPWEFATTTYADPACAENCAGAADAWMAQVAGCIPDVDEACVRSLLIDICQNGCSNDNPLGSSGQVGGPNIVGTCAAPGTLVFATFDDVLAYYGTDCPTIVYPPVMPGGDGCACDNLTTFLTELGYGEVDAITSTIANTVILPALQELDATFTSGSFYSDLGAWLSACRNGTPLPGTFPAVLRCLPIPAPASDCATDAAALAGWNQALVHQQRLEAGATAFAQGYRAHCLQGLADRETFTLTYDLKEYHYMLYYYDQAGNLVKTVPPEGVQLALADYRLDDDGTLTDPAWTTDAELEAAVQANRQDPANNPFVRPGHTLVTWNTYNSFQQPVTAHTPDGGSTGLWYDPAGRVVASQDAQQAVDGLYAYVRYDVLGRTYESGLTPAQLDPLTPDIARRVDVAYPNGMESYLSATTRREVTRTYYDRPLSTPISDRFGTAGQQHLQARVASVTFEEVWDGEDPGDELTYDQGTHYTYDIHGNVSTLLQEIHDLRGLGQDFKRIDHEYDLVSGHVNAVHYQAGEWDEFHHRYRYDADDRLQDVYTSTDGRLWDRDARYLYYAHGPLARTELGRKQVQGIDHTYTINGWLRTVNAASLAAGDDPGRDGHTSGLDRHFAQDAFAYDLNYFDTDYYPAGGTAAQQHLPQMGGTFSYQGLYNGNIPAMLTALRQAGTYGSGQFDPLPLHAKAYTYDVLNRLKEQAVFKGMPADGGDADTRIELTALSDDGDYANTFSYDGNGNLMTMGKNGDPSASPLSAQAMDAFTYIYPTDGSGHRTSNRLTRVEDTTPAGNYTNDLDGQTGTNYTYHADGSLKSDASAGIGSIAWNAQNKVRRVLRSSGSLADLEFRYNASGQRTVKIVKPRAGGSVQPQHQWEYTYYIHDAQGTPMAVYRRTRPHLLGGAPNEYADKLQQTEVPFYGSDRLGLWATPRQCQGTFTATLIYSLDEQADVFTAASYVPLPPTDNGLGTYPLHLKQILGEKRFEGKDHLGNVLSVLSDRTVPEDLDNNDVVERYLPLQLSQEYYYPFGDPLPMAGLASSGYRFGFQGQEKDDEIHGVTGTSYAFEYRMHDPRIGRFLSLDPIMAKYPWNSPYAFAENSVIRYCDLEGLERGDNPAYWGKTGLVLATDTDADAEGRIQRQMHATLNTPPPPDPRLQFQSTATIDIPDRDKVQKQVLDEVGEISGLADGGRLVFGRDETGELTIGQRIKAGAFIFLPSIAGKIGKPLLKGFTRIAETSGDFYKKASRLAAGERVALYRTTAANIAEKNGWAKNSQLSKRFNRDIYSDAEKNIYSLDTQHGHFELLNEKGKHQGAMDFDGILKEVRDETGQHDLDIK